MVIPSNEALNHLGVHNELTLTYVKVRLALTYKTNVNTKIHQVCGLPCPISLGAY